MLVPPAAYITFLVLKRDTFALMVAFLNVKAGLVLNRETAINGRRRVTRNNCFLAGIENIIIKEMPTGITLEFLGEWTKLTIRYVNDQKESPVCRSLGPVTARYQVH